MKPEDVPSTSSSIQRTTRSSSEGAFPWKTNCFLCGARCYPNKRKEWCQVEESIDELTKGKLPTTYKKVQEAALKRGDNVVLLRLQEVPNKDLVSAEARYCRNKTGKNACSLANYYKIPAHLQKTSACSDHSIVKMEDISNENLNQVEKLEMSYELSLDILIEQLKPRIESGDVLKLSDMRNEFRRILKDNGFENYDQYTSQKLKQKLEKRWPVLRYITQRGDTQLVCSDVLPVGDIIARVIENKGNFSESSDDEMEETPVIKETDEVIAHKFVEMIRRRTKYTKLIKNEFYSAGEMNLKSWQEFVDPLLYKTIGWLADKHLYESGQDCPLRADCLNIACDITTLCTSVPSPKHVGLAVTFQHKYGKRDLIEILNTLGECMSYSATRQFLTSTAVYISKKQTPSEIQSFIPPELTPISEGGNLISAAGDNWDHDEHTVDGKRTTHAMTTMQTQQINSNQVSCHLSERIPKQSKRTIDMHELQGNKSIMI